MVFRGWSAGASPGTRTSGHRHGPRGAVHRRQGVERLGARAPPGERRHAEGMGRVADRADVGELRDRADVGPTVRSDGALAALAVAPPDRTRRDATPSDARSSGAPITAAKPRRRGPRGCRAMSPDTTTPPGSHRGCRPPRTPRNPPLPWGSCGSLWHMTGLSLTATRDPAIPANAPPDPAIVATRPPSTSSRGSREGGAIPPSPSVSPANPVAGSQVQTLLCR